MCIRDRVLWKLPQAGNLLLCELVAVTLVGVLILVPAQIHKLGIILVDVYKRQKPYCPYPFQGQNY